MSAGVAASRRGVLVLTLVLLLAASGCTYAKEEPGLFSERQAPSSAPPVPPVPEPSRQPVAATNPHLPVVGRQLWTSSDGHELQLQLAVHAIRRIPGATVLDWSVTPLTAPGLRPGDPLPDDISLGLRRDSDGGVTIVLVDPERGKVYRPLSHGSGQEFHHCLCSPVWWAQRSLRLAETRMLQITYPSLPAGVLFLDAAFATLPPFVHVPVTALGQVPTAQQPTDLTQAPDLLQPLSRPPVSFRYPADQTKRALGITVDRVIASRRYTSVQWRITSLTKQTSGGLFPPKTPLAAVLPAGVSVASRNALSGLRLQPTGRSRALDAWWMTESNRHLGLLECLCTELGLWASSLREPGGQAWVTTNFPPLPPGVTVVDVVVPGVGRLPRLPVDAAADSAQDSGPPTAAPPREPWTYLPDNPLQGWPTSDWPTPVPAQEQLASYRVAVEDLVELPR